MSLWKWITAKFFGSALNYKLSYVADISLVIFFLVWETTVWRSPISHVVFGRIAGFVIFTLSEYILHRWVYHYFSSFVRDLHNVHHVKPLSMIATPWFLTASIAIGLWWMFTAVVHIPILSSLFAGWQAGTLWYGVVHHSHHHWKTTNSWIRKVKVHHLVHHQFPEYNFGISSRFWDTVFGTRYRRVVGVK